MPKIIIAPKAVHLFEECGFLPSKPEKKILIRKKECKFRPKCYLDKTRIMLSIFRKKNLTFKTNINCGGCIEKVKPFLDKVESIDKWDVNTSTPDKTLTVYGEKINKEEVISAVKKSGFEINNK